MSGSNPMYECYNVTKNMGKNLGKYWLVVALALFSLVLQPGAADAKKKRSKAKPSAPTKQSAHTTGGRFQSALECGKCHAELYKSWIESRHSRSFSDPAFQAAYNKAYVETKGGAVRECLGCHAPVTLANADNDVRQEVTREGVTCDFCHSISEADPDRSPRFKLAPGTVKTGVRAGPPNEGHQTAASKDFASSRVCAVCHDFSNSKGVHTETTYMEWKNSQHSKNGTQCQTCHMPEVVAQTSTNEGGKKFRDHSFDYGTASLKGAFFVETKGAAVVDGVLVADVLVENRGAGHYAPTGTPARSLVLEATTYDSADRRIETRKMVYSKAVLGEDGRAAVACADAYLNGCKAGKDNRLAPGESRVETFNFTARLKNVARVDARLYLLYQPYVMMRTIIETDLSSSSVKVSRPENEDTKK